MATRSSSMLSSGSFYPRGDGAGRGAEHRLGLHRLPDCRTRSRHSTSSGISGYVATCMSPGRTVAIRVWGSDVQPAKWGQGLRPKLSETPGATRARPLPHTWKSENDLATMSG